MFDKSILPTTPLFKLNGVCWNLTSKNILKNISLSLPRNKIIGIIGPNGAGKSSLLKAMHGQIKTSQGTVDFNDQPILQYGLKDKAKQIAYIEQLPELTFDLSVYDAVLAGRLPYQGLFSFSNSSDKNRVLSALEKMELLDKVSQPFNTLSGGEQQRALIARSLVQGATTLLLDEPTNHLDIRHQLELMQTLQEFDGSVIMTIHDLNMASHYCDYLILINEGEVVKYGEPKEVLNAELISTTYKVETVVKESSLGTPYLYFCLAESDPINNAEPINSAEQQQ